jgi:type IV pilus assembly protein PilY1
MYDLTYIDNGTPTRDATYCYDQTYISTKTYAGYFEKDTAYVYNFASKRFEAGSPPAVCSHLIPGELCVDIVSGLPSTVINFVARGNYLNWLTASKFDVQKQILTGGKYDTTASEFIAESRGCVGRSFIKEALTKDYVEGGTNTSLGVVFAISGPPNEYNPSGISNGGQTYIDIYEGDYNEVLCQTAIEAIIYSSNPSSIRTALEDCLSYDPNASAGSQYCFLDPGRSCTVDSDCDVIAEAGDCSSGPKISRKCLAPASKAGQSCVNDSDCNTVGSSVGPCVGSHSAEVNTKIAFNQSMQECWQIWSGSKTEVGSDAWSAESLKCAEIYAGYKICNGGDNDGDTCASDAECTGGGTCIAGPAALRPGNPALMCNSSYTGYCATSGDGWTTTTWVSKEYDDPEECFLEKYNEYCGAVKVPPVIDPSDTPDDTAETANIPAIISDIGVEAQLGEPIGQFTVKRYEATGPTGLLHDYSKVIRFGVMKFNFNGSDSECSLSSTDPMTCPRICSSTTSIVCTTDLDCPGGETCNSTATNQDAAKIAWYIGDGKCSVSGSACVRDDQCPVDEECIPIVGDHDTGLIKAIDDIQAGTWTPFSEAYYDAIAYYVNDATSNPDLDPAGCSPTADAIQNPLNANDFVSGKNPIEWDCQSNNILIISDGSAAADLNPTVTTKVTDPSNFFNDGDADDPASCGSYLGSSHLDDLSYFAKHRNIFNPADATPENTAQRITTYVVYTGADASTITGECEPKTLMNNTAVNGGTELYHAEKPDELLASLESAFMTISDDRSSGTAVSVLSTTGEGEGAIYQAYFYPSKQDAETDFEIRKWFGYVHALFADDYGNIREDTNGNDALDLKTDLIIEMSYDTDLGSLANRYTDSNGDGERDSDTPVSTVSIEDVASLWRAGDELWATDPLNRKIYATADGTARIDFDPGSVVDLEPLLRGADNTETVNIIDWVRGYDFTDSAVGFDFKPYATGVDAGHPSGYRQRSVTPSGMPDPHVWKLGDIIYSTPSSVARPMENYDMLYHDSTYYQFFKKYINRRNVVYIGANDGMLHAFNGGFFDDRIHAYCTSINGSGECASKAGDLPLGAEMWGFIPRGMLPHLKWMTDPGYSHVYYVDLKPKITDVKIFGNGDPTHPDGWGTILIGGYRYGGKDISWTAPDGSPQKAYPEYYALDITDPESAAYPKLLWSFPNDDVLTQLGVSSIGLTMSYPAVAKVGDKWFAIFGSSASGFEADSDLTGFNDGYVYVLDLSSSNSAGEISTWTKDVNYWRIETNHSKAYLANPITIDVDMDYNVDVIYIGENYDDGTGWNAHMRRITTDHGTELNPDNWAPTTLADIKAIAGGNDDAKRITAAPSAAIDDQSKLWIYFGTGQFLGDNDKNRSDAGAFYAVKDACWNGSCGNDYTEFLDVSKAMVKTDESVTDVTTCAAAAGANNWSELITAANACEGWTLYFKNLVEAKDFLNEDLIHGGERVFTKPLIIGGLVAFGAYVPGIGCDYLGESNAYALYYKTGTAYTKYLFKEQKEQTSPSDVVARTIRLGEGMPSSPSGQKEKDGTAKVYFQQSTGRIITAEHETPIDIKSALKGWRKEQIP